MISHLPVAIFEYLKPRNFVFQLLKFCYTKEKFEFKMHEPPQERHWSLCCIYSINCVKFTPTDTMVPIIKDNLADNLNLKHLPVVVITKPVNVKTGITKKKKKILCFAFIMHHDLFRRIMTYEIDWLGAFCLNVFWAVRTWRKNIGTNMYFILSQISKGGLIEGNEW